MPARVARDNGENNKKRPKVQVKAPIVNDKKQEEIKQEMEAILAQNQTPQDSSNQVDRAQFYGGHERLNLQGSSVQRVRDLQEENDHLQREVVAKEQELASATDPLVTLADIEHRKVMVARNTGEILKIYLKNEERMKRICDLEEHNSKIQNEMMEMQGRFISTKNMEEKTKFASEFFILKSEIERNLEEINGLNKK